MASAEFENLLVMLAPIRESFGSVDGLEQFRSGYDAMGAMLPLPEGVTVTEVVAGGVPAEWIEPEGGGGDAAVLYLHGGGYVLGAPDSHRPMVAHLVARLGAPALLIDYRLAPEHPFPAAVDDAVAAYEWLIDRVGSAAKLAIAGDSAGGGLTVAMLLALRERDLPQPAAAVPISPWTDLALTGETMDTHDAVDVMVGREGLSWMADAYLAGHAATDPLASPLHGDLSGLPPLLIHVGGRETLLDDARRLAAGVVAQDGEVEITIEPEMIHVWHLFAGMLPEANESLDEIAGFLRPRLGL
jgi:phosphinothricin tripeptide acetyl hydrolase